jgi:hypothetical protein
MACGEGGHLSPGLGQVEDPAAGRLVTSTTFSATVSGGISMKCWCTMPMPSLMASSGADTWTGRPSKSTSPSSGRVSP